jgi:hypothetical protein
MKLDLKLRAKRVRFLQPQGLTGSKLEKLCDHASITLNKNSVPKDTSALSPGMQTSARFRDFVCGLLAMSTVWLNDRYCEPLNHLLGQGTFPVFQSCKVNSAEQFACCLMPCSNCSVIHKCFAPVRTFFFQSGQE